MIIQLSTDILLCLLDVLQEHRTDIDAHKAAFQAFQVFGQQLLSAQHYAEPEIKEKLDMIQAEKDTLERCVILLSYLLILLLICLPTERLCSMLAFQNCCVSFSDLLFWFLILFSDNGKQESNVLTSAWNCRYRQKERSNLLIRQFFFFI